MERFKNSFVVFYKPLSFLFLLNLIYSCINANASEDVKNNNKLNKKERIVSNTVKKYWYDGNAEISSFHLKQIRYGELHEGTAVLVYVTEPFSKIRNTKADSKHSDNVSVLKLNTTKKFNTGIYPYSMMNSSFFPVEGSNNSLKITSSIQEWCGMTFLEMKNDKDFNFNLSSYFEGASFKNKKIEKKLLEDDLWSLIRLNPELLPKGELQIIPSMFFLNSMHKKIKSYTANLTLKKESKITSYEISYPELNRKIIIRFKSEFPNKITGWSETYSSDYGANRKTLTTEAKLIKNLKVDYWNKNSNKDKHWRNKLGL